LVERSKMDIKKYKWYHVDFWFKEKVNGLHRDIYYLNEEELITFKRLISLFINEIRNI